MKKVLKIAFLLFVSALFFSCVSLSSIIKNEQIDIPFEGTMDTRLGYENLLWGTSYRKIKEAGIYPIIEVNYYSNTTTTVKYFLGYDERYDGESHLRRYAHGDVEESQFFFTPETKLLYQVTDILSVKNPSLEYLHSRYGDFNEENVASEKFKAKGGVMYTNQGCIDGLYWYTLIISIESSGRTTVIAYDPFAYVTINKSPVWDSKYTNIQNDTWYCWANIQGASKAIDYTFIQKNVDNKWLIFGYHKSLESPSRSYVRSGLGWGSYTNGKYEIKSGTDIVSYDFSSLDWKCDIIDVRFSHTKGDYRKMTEVFLNGEKFTVRHRDKITEFNTSGFSEILAKWGISVEELDYAISNEEF